ncbi:MAG: serine hydrolase [Thermodesulfobacteriota bacterium]|nr:serine hydrolase [Thermodesulfobacteriota bacterium]
MIRLPKKFRLFAFRSRLSACTILFVVFLSLSLCGCIIEDIPSGTGYGASNICTGVFVTGIEETRMTNDFVAPEIAPLPLIWEVEVNHDDRQVLVYDRIFRNYYAATAIYREGLGCSCLGTKTVDELMAQAPDTLLHLELPRWRFWPHGSAGIYPFFPRNIDQDAIENAIDRSFAEDAQVPKNTVAVAIVYDGKLIAERYANGFTPFTPIIGWSMSKSVTSAMVGVQQGWGLLNVADDDLFHEWTGTEKAAITIENLLQMSSGLEYYEEPRGDNADQSRMLYTSDDHAAYMIEKELIHDPGTVWNYSTGDTMLLSKIVQDSVGGELADAYAFMQADLFHRVDIANAVVEFDPSGTFIGGARIAMTARDWARMGLLHLQDGMWDGERILPEGWVDYATTPTATNISYGAQIWLNTEQALWPDFPEDAYGFRGHNGQNVIIIPSRKLIVVRMGYTFNMLTDPVASAAEPTRQLVVDVMAAIGAPNDVR